MTGEGSELGGEYIVDGKNPDGSWYQGEAALRVENGLILIVWTVSGQKTYGKAVRQGSEITVIDTDIRYTIQKEGILEGTWSETGTEKLTPKSIYLSVFPGERSRSILILTCDPHGARDNIRETEEIRVIEEKIKLSKLSAENRIQVVSRVAVRPEDLTQALYDSNPEIVHFSGHGTEGRICLQDDDADALPVDPEALAGILGDTETVKCVVLSACDTAPQAEAIVRLVEYAVGMKEPIEDESAISFSIGFYQAIGAGKSFEEAFRAGCRMIRTRGRAEDYHIPVLMKKGSSPEYPPVE
jgi:hypothetical protein